jgi:hypothetical protein
MGQNDEQQGQGTSGQPQNTAPERDGHEFPRTNEAAATDQQEPVQDAGFGDGEDVDDGRGSGQTQQGQQGFDDAGREETQRAASVGAGDSWRPSADPAAGDMADTSDREDTTQKAG